MVNGFHWPGARPGRACIRGQEMTRNSAPLVVYIVDDDDAVRDGFCRLIRSAGMDARPFADSQAFLAAVVDQSQACVLLDVTLPNLGGLQVQECLNEREIRLPVITVSARDDKETRLRARGLGAKLFLRKPVDDQALLDAISWVTGVIQAR